MYFTRLHANELRKYAEAGTSATLKDEAGSGKAHRKIHDDGHREKMTHDGLSERGT
jgi:hypothetical protein